MARISGVDLPNDKRVEIGLTYIYGIGLTTSKKIIAEIQIRTLAMNFWATVEHTLNYKYQGKYPEDISKRLKTTAEAAYKLDEEMSSIKDEVQEAQRIFTKSKGKEQ